MGLVIRPRFGRPCFECGDPVPLARAKILEDDAAVLGRNLLKSDLLCVECQRASEIQTGVVVTPRPRLR
jgi:RNA polymerase-binding transcription factor DksA